MTAGQNARARTRTGRTSPKLLHSRVLFRSVNKSAEGGSEETFVPGCIGDDVVTPIVKDTTMRIGEAVGGVALELAGERLEAVNAAVVVAHRAGRGLNLCAMEHAVTQIRCSARLEHHGVGGVMRISGVHAHQHAFFPVSLAVAVGVTHEPQVWRLHDQHAVFVKLETSRAVQIIEEGRDLVGLAVIVRVLEH